MTKSILLIEDSEFYGKTLKKLFAKVDDNIEIFLATTGEEGINLAKKHKPDLILLDIMLPDITGDKVFQELSDNEETSEIKIVFLSGLTEQGVKEKFYHNEKKYWTLSKSMGFGQIIDQALNFLKN